MNKEQLRGYCLVAAFTVALYLGLSNLDKLRFFTSMLLGLLSPFLIGLVIAFLLNNPVMWLESKVFRRCRHARILSLAGAYLASAAAITILLWFVLPQLLSSLNQLKNNIPGFLASFQGWLEQAALSLQFSPEVWQQFSTGLQNLAESLLSLIPRLFGILPKIYDMLAAVGSGMFNFFIGFVVSIYLLLGKEQLLSQLSRLNNAFLPKGLSRWLPHAGGITVRIFQKYITGQLTDALIVGVISVAGLSILRFPYALLIGVLLGCTNVIPFFGPFIGFFPGFLIIAMESPVQALWFTLFVVVMQQIDGNLIVPRVVGQSVGLPALWVLFSVTVGGALFGIAGMIIGMPLFAVFYRLLGEATHKREQAADTGAEG